MPDEETATGGVVGMFDISGASVDAITRPAPGGGLLVVTEVVPSFRAEQGDL